MQKKWLRHKQDGTIYAWNPILARDPLCEEITDAEVFPDRAPKVEQAETPAKPAKKAAKKKVVEPPKLDIVFTEDDLREEASRGLP